MFVAIKKKDYGHLESNTSILVHQKARPQSTAYYILKIYAWYESNFIAHVYCSINYHAF